jgi:hypothetical protein
MRTSKLLIALSLLALGGAVSGLAAAGSSSVSAPRLGDNVIVPADKVGALARRMPSAATDATPSAGPAAAAFAPEPIPAAILGSNVPAAVPASILTETNGWLVSNGSNLVAVYAGSAADDPTQGRIVIVRQNLRTGAQTMHVVDTGATGALAVAAGAPVETTALNGRIPLSTGRGTVVKLNLGTDTVGGN